VSARDHVRDRARAIPEVEGFADQREIRGRLVDDDEEGVWWCAFV
jgi:hypothetical protein